MNESNYTLNKEKVILKIFDKVKVKIYVQVLGLDKRENLVVEYVPDELSSSDKEQMEVKEASSKKKKIHENASDAVAFTGEKPKPNKKQKRSE